MSEPLFEVSFSEDEFKKDKAQSGDSVEKPEDLSFVGKLQKCEQKLQEEREERDLNDLSLNSELGEQERKYVDLVCECSEEEYISWLDYTRDQQMFKVMSLREKKSEGDFDNLLQDFFLYRRAKLEREKMQEIQLH